MHHQLIYYCCEETCCDKSILSMVELQKCRANKASHYQLEQMTLAIGEKQLVIGLTWLKPVIYNW